MVFGQLRSCALDRYDQLLLLVGRCLFNLYVLVDTAADE